MNIETDTPDSPDSVVTFETVGAIGVITLNRPAARNAITDEVALLLGRALERLDAEPGVRVGVLTGAGAVFCAGMDLKQFAASPDRALPLGDDPAWGFGGFSRHPIATPIIAAVNGAALGGGAELALACDLIVADESAVFGLPEARHGLLAIGGGPMRLAQSIPARIAMELVLTGRSMDAAEASSWGLVNRIAPAGTSRAVAIELAETIAANAPASVVAGKRLIAATATSSALDDAPWAISDAALAEVFATDDALEGPTAFAEKRAPKWTGR